MTACTQLQLLTPFPFLQAHVVSSRKYGGTGIGLSICQKLIHLKGEKVPVATREGAGSMFQSNVVVGFGKPENEAKELRAEGEAFLCFVNVSSKHKETLKTR
jgi:hypothetical protein